MRPPVTPRTEARARALPPAHRAAAPVPTQTAHLRPTPRPSLGQMLRASAATVFLSLCLSLAAQAQVPTADDLRALVYYLDTNDQRSV
jgi:hypothetical protein